MRKNNNRKRFASFDRAYFDSRHSYFLYEMLALKTCVILYSAFHQINPDFLSYNGEFDIYKVWRVQCPQYHYFCFVHCFAFRLNQYRFFFFNFMCFFSSFLSFIILVVWRQLWCTAVAAVAINCVNKTHVDWARFIT